MIGSAVKAAVERPSGQRLDGTKWTAVKAENGDHLRDEQGNIVYEEWRKGLPKLRDMENIDRQLLRTFEYMGRPEQYKKWGFAVSRTTYSDDQKWAEVLHVLREAIMRNVYFDIQGHEDEEEYEDRSWNDDWWAKFEVVPFSNRAKFEHKSLDEIRPIFREWVLEDVDRTVERFKDEDHVHQRWNDANSELFPVERDLKISKMRSLVERNKKKQKMLGLWGLTKVLCIKHA